MAKRFTDTEKWKSDWFLDLSLKDKLVWQYICDNCNHAGIWKVSSKHLSFAIGQDVDQEYICGVFGDKLHEVESGKFFIPSFILFQYGRLRPEVNAHKSVIKELAKYFEIIDGFVVISNSFQTVQQQLSNTSPSVKDKDKNQDKDKDKDKNKNKNSTPKNKDSTDDDFYDAVVDIWNGVAELCKIPQVTKPINPKRKKHLKQALIQMPDLKDWGMALCQLTTKPFYLGENDRNWKANFDWFIAPTKTPYLTLAEEAKSLQEASDD